MFQRFTSLFFSDSSTVEVVEEPKPFVSKEEEEDGWLIIDLPEGPDAVSMESSPMEDLLIEHPSMSVYVTTTSSIIVEREDPEENIQENEIPENCLQRRPPHHSTSLATKTAILEKVNQVRRIQRAKQLAEKHKLSQKVMKRQNRARECRPNGPNPKATSSTNHASASTTTKLLQEVYTVGHYPFNF